MARLYYTRSLCNLVRENILTMTPPYSLEQAKYLSSVYRGLIGSKFDDGKSLIEDVLIIPFDQASKQRFILYYMVMSQDAQDVVLQEYKGFLFDILVISRNAAGDMIYKELSVYLASDAARDEMGDYTQRPSSNNQLFLTDSLS